MCMLFMYERKRKEYRQALQTESKDVEIIILETGSVQPVNRDSVCGEGKIVQVHSLNCFLVLTEHTVSCNDFDIKYSKNIITMCFKFSIIFVCMME